MRSWVAAVVLSMAAFGCSGRATEEQADSANLDLVTQEKFDHARKILETIDYLPFHYLFDGCTARALYMSMELAVEGIESSAVFAYADGPQLRVKDASWVFHVAPMFVVGPDRASSKRIVVDPSIDPAPLGVDAWVRRMGVRVKPGEPGYPRVFVVAGSDFWPADQNKTLPDGDVADFESLPPFASDDILEACNVAYKWIGREPDLSDEARATKRTALVSRSAVLVSRLAQKSKLSEKLDGPLDLARLQEQCVGKPQHTGVD